jgi:hypothetical protein
VTVTNDSKTPQDERDRAVRGARRNPERAQLLGVAGLWDVHPPDRQGLPGADAAVHPQRHPIRRAGVNAISPSTPAVTRPALRCVTWRTLTSVFDQDRSIIFCKDRTCAQSCSCVALKILRRSRRT